MKTSYPGRKPLDILRIYGDYWGMQRIGSILGGLNSGFSRLVKVRGAWNEITGDVLSAHTEPVNIKGRVLCVMCEDPAWVQQVNLLSTMILPRIKELSGVHIDKIQPRFGMKSSAKSRKLSRKVPRVPDIDPAVLDSITDPVLRASVAELVGIRKDENDG